jgi:hypothetical protein
MKFETPHRVVAKRHARQIVAAPRLTQAWGKHRLTTSLQRLGALHLLEKPFLAELGFEQLEKGGRFCQ